MSVVARAAKSITWTFDPTVDPDHDIIREHVMLEGGGIFTGKSVSIEKAMGFVPIMAAISLRSETIGSLPFGTFERLEGNAKRPAPEHRIYDMLHDQANPEMTSFIFREVMQSHIEAWGNCYAEIEYDTDDFPLYLWPLRPDRMEVYREDGKLVYFYTLPDGTRTKLNRRRLFHIPGLGYDGRVGYSRIHMARQAIALGLAAEEMAGRFYSNDARPGVAIKLGPEFDYDDDAKKRLAESWDATHAGLSNKHRTAILDEGMGIEQIGFPADDAQLVEQQKWSVEQVCRIFNIPPHMLHALDRATFNNVEELGLNFVTYSLRPWLVRWEQQVKMQLLAGDTKHFAEFNVDGLLRGKLEDRMKAYWQMFQMGSLSPDEIRAKENLNPRADGAGDRYYVPVNVGQAGETEVEEGEEQLPVLPPLQLATGTRSAKALTPAQQRRALAEEFKPLFEKVTASVVEFEAKQVLAEAERRFASTEATKAFAEAMGTRQQQQPTVVIHMPESTEELPVAESDGASLEAIADLKMTLADAVGKLEHRLAEVSGESQKSAGALIDLRAEMARRKTIVRDENGRIVGVK